MSNRLPPGSSRCQRLAPQRQPAADHVAEGIRVGAICHYLAHAEKAEFAPGRLTFDLLPTAGIPINGKEPAKAPRVPVRPRADAIGTVARQVATAFEWDIRHARTTPGATPAAYLPLETMNTSSPSSLTTVLKRNPDFRASLLGTSCPAPASGLESLAQAWLLLKLTNSPLLLGLAGFFAFARRSCCRSSAEPWRTTPIAGKSCSPATLP